MPLAQAGVKKCILFVMVVFSVSSVWYIMNWKLMFTTYYTQFFSYKENSRRNQKGTFIPDLAPPLTHSKDDVHYFQAADGKFWAKSPLSVYEAIAQHRPKTLDDCNNTCDPREPYCNATDPISWTRIGSSGLLPYRPFLGKGQYVFGSEKKMLSFPPLVDLSTLPDLSLSKVVLNDVQNGIVKCKMFEYLRGRVDLYDGYGRRRIRGNDELRVWVKSTDVKGYASSGEVTDLNNGSYVFIIQCLWSGNSSLSIALMYPREFLRIVWHQIHIGATRHTYVSFAKNNYKETTLCWFTPEVPGRPCVCNITFQKQEMFYCGRPKDTRLTCDDWNTTGFIFIPPPHDVTPEEYKLIQTCPGVDSASLIKHNISVFTAFEGKQSNLPACQESNLSGSWNTTKPTGFWTRGFEWNSLICKLNSNVTINWAQDCLKNSTTWIIGDSNANMLYLSFLAITGCINKTGGWPRSSMCVVQQHGIKIIAIPHEKPIYAKLQRADHIGSIPAVLDNINSTGKHIVFVHYYLHYTPAHPSVFYLRMKALKAAVERLVKRNPNVLTVIRGPHVALQDCKHNRAIGGDPLAPLYIEIIKTMFRGLENKVLFLNGWDLTIAIESNGIHPPAFVTREMIKIVLSYFCK